jgi:D-tagatose-1,6-bisphosphate aldolase subunit GatZ/KbaZ
MEKVRTLVRAYTEADFEKIHLDASMFCADDPGDRKLPLADKVVAERAAELCGVCEEAPETGKVSPCILSGPRFLFPAVPGTKRTQSDQALGKVFLKPWKSTKKPFFAAGLEDAWNRVAAVGAQPGVEFSDRKVFHYNRETARELSGALENTSLVFETHSTDYQRPSGLREMVEDHFCILKVGPWLTFRYREAPFPLPG